MPSDRLGKLRFGSYNLGKRSAASPTTPGRPGLVLGLWGTPVGYPGVFRWSDLGSLEYGAAWQASFLVKMAGVAAGVLGTAAALRQRHWGARLGTAGLGLALIAVTALSQFHVLTHG